MSREDQAAPAIVYLLADNLDAALAAGEDLLKSSFTWHGCDARSAEELAESRPKEREALDAIRSLELILLARVLKSRETAAELAKTGLRPIAKLYTAGTTILSEAVDQLGDRSSAEFDSGECMTAYLRSRRLIAEDAPAPAEGQQIRIGEDFLMCGLVPLGSVLDLVAHFLDTLETHYDLYAPRELVGSDARPQEGSAPNEADLLSLSP